MLKRTLPRLTFLRSAHRPVEDDAGLRIAVGAAVGIAIAALLAQDVVDAPVGIAVLLLTPVGFYVSWRRRHSGNFALKVALAAGALLAFADFLRGISGAGSIDETRTPLAEIFLWVQTLNSFDQPRRKNLHFSLAASLVVLAQAGSLAIDLRFLGFFSGWGLAAVVALVLSYRSEVRERQRAMGSPSVRGGGGVRSVVSPRTIGAVLVTVIVAGSLAFLFAPRGSGRYLAGFPFQIPNIVPIPQGSGVVNPGLSNSFPGIEPGVVAPGAYFGFGNFVDLRVRAELPDDIVMRVRADRAAFWRGMVFDTYERSVWTNSDEDPSQAIGLPADIPHERGIPPINGETITQTFYVERDQPNIIFAAYHPSLVWFPGRMVEFDTHRALRAQVLLTDDLVYSVISEMPVYSRADLDSGLDSGLESVPAEVAARYTQLPPDLPQRVRDLAVEIAGGAGSTIGKVEAIDRWLAEHTRYRLDIPPQPRGKDAVDHFLFEEKEGYCEQIASAMTVMLRSLGVPARFATGYAPGDRNLFSGFFEVRASDAHSWVEVYLPRVGWVQFDPTHEVPPAILAPGSSVPGIEVLRKIGRAIGRLVPDEVPRAMGDALRSLFASSARWGPGLAAALAGVALSAVIARPLARRLRRWERARRLSRPIGGASKESIPAAFRLVEEAGALAGMPRPPSFTPSEFADALAGKFPSDVARDIEQVVQVLHREIYGGIDAGREEAAASEAAAKRVWSAVTGISSRR